MAVGSPVAALVGTVAWVVVGMAARTAAAGGTAVSLAVLLVAQAARVGVGAPLVVAAVEWWAAVEGACVVVAAVDLRVGAVEEVAMEATAGRAGKEAAAAGHAHRR